MYINFVFLILTYGDVYDKRNIKEIEYIIKIKRKRHQTLFRMMDGSNQEEHQVRDLQMPPKQISNAPIRFPNT